MQKPSVKKLLLIVGILTLTLAAFIVGSITTFSAQAASTNTQGKGTVQAGCDTKAPQCKDDHKDNPTNQIKAIITVNAITGNQIRATFLEPLDKKGSTVTITTTASTIYKPSRSVVAAGKTVFVSGTVNSDGSVTASVLGFYDPSVATYGGVVSSIDGLVISVQAKNLTYTIHLTASTTFLAIQPMTKTTSPASRSDLKVGDIVKAHGTLNKDGSLTAETVLITPPGVSKK